MIIKNSLGGESIILEIVCDSNLNNIFYILKTILDIIMIIAPILAIVSLAMHIFNGTIDPDNKKNLSKFKNTIKALMIIFIIPLLINIVALIIGEKTSLTSCWNNTRRNSIKIKYYDKKEKTSKKTKAYTDSKKYHGKTKAPGLISNSSNISTNLNFTCTSRTVKAQFSCDTLRIVEKHLYDFDATNFNSVINTYGGFDAYAKSVGGIFGEYYGKKMPNNTETDFQRAAEYVLGWMYMYGWDYMNTQGQHYKWGTGSKYSNDAFYVNGGWKREYSGKFDDLISGKNGLDMLSSECGDLEIFVYWKLGISHKKSIKNPASLRELKVGDAIFFYDGTFENKTWRHTALVGEVYNDRIVFYDAGSRYTRSRNYKYTVEIPSNTSASAELTALKKHYVYDGWIAKRYYNFKAG